MTGPRAPATPGIHVLAKPIGSICDIACDDCFYLEKREPYPRGQSFRMPDEVLAKYIGQHGAAQPGPVVDLVRHGGVPGLPNRGRSPEACRSRAAACSAPAGTCKRPCRQGAH